MAYSVSETNSIDQSSGEAIRRSLPNVSFLATGSFAPDQIVANEDLARLGCDEEWIVQRTGIRERRHAPDDMSTGDMAYEAGKQCLEQAEVEPSEIDLFILATMTPDYFTPSTSCMVQKRLGLQCPSMDINAACSGFLFAMITGAQFVDNGCARKVLVIGADVMSRVANPDDVKTFPLFGDGAGALLLGHPSSDAPHKPIRTRIDGANRIAGTNGSNGNSQRKPSGILSYTLGSDGDTEGWLCVPGGAYKHPPTQEMLATKGNFLVMDGRPVFKWAVRLIADSILEVLNDAGLGPDDISLVVLHQANIRILDAAVSDLGFARKSVFVNLEKYGNTSAGSIPLALDEANREGRLRRGDNVLFCGFGSGLAWGACIAKW